MDPGQAGWLPSVPGVYAFVAYPSEGASGAPEVLYIGQAEDLFERLADTSHHRLDAAAQRARRAKRHLIFALLQVEGGPDLKKRLDAIEQALIYNKKPPLNVLHKEEYKGRHIVLTIEGAEGILPARLNLAPAPVNPPTPPRLGGSLRPPSPAMLALQAMLSEPVHLQPIPLPGETPFDTWARHYSRRV